MFTRWKIDLLYCCNQSHGIEQNRIETPFIVPQWGNVAAEKQQAIKKGHTGVDIRKCIFKLKIQNKVKKGSKIKVKILYSKRRKTFRM